tara:strand:+ start:5035 stop:9132 length:4098 start_codon:yes stop_codon:yes gene_type:complete
MSDRQMRWNYPLMGVTENKSMERTSTPRGAAYELVGVDLSRKGGIRPHPGFKKVHSFTGISTREVLDFKPVSFRVGTNQYGYGYVYKVKKASDATQADIYIDYYVKGYNSGAWNRTVALKSNISATSPMDVVIFGRFIFVMQKGMQTVLFFLDYENSVQATSTISITDNDAITATAAAATGAIAFTGATTTGNTVKLTDHAGLSKTYKAYSGATAGELDTDGNVKFSNSGDKNDNASSLRNAIMASNGHNGTIVAVWSAGTGNIALTQSVATSAGNTTIIDGLANCTVTSFTGGATITQWVSSTGDDGDNAVAVQCHSSTNSSIYFTKGGSASATATSIATAINANTGKMTAETRGDDVIITQVKYGKAGNKITTVSGVTWCTKNHFTGGKGPVYNTDQTVASYKQEIDGDTGPGLRPELLPIENTTTVGALDNPASVVDTDANAHLFVISGATPSYWDTTPTGQDNLPNMEVGNYSFAYLLEDPITGRRTALSPVVPTEEASDAMYARATGRITVLSGTHSDHNADTITISDSEDDAGHTVVFTFSDGHTEAAKLSDSEYIIGISGAATTTFDIANRIYDSIALAKTNGDLDITASDPGGDLEYVSLTHDLAGAGRNATISTTGSASHLTVSGMSGGTVFTKIHFGIEIVYREDKYTKAHIYRSVRIEGAGGSYAGSVMQLEKIIDLGDFATTDQTGITDDRFKRSIYMYTKPDLELLYMTPYTDRTIFDAEMPQAGAGIEFDGILMCSDIDGTATTSSGEETTDDRYRGVGEFRWSTMASASPENFPAENYFMPSKIANEVITFEKSGGAVLGFCNNVIMHITRETSGFVNYMKILPIHEGYGIINRNAAVTVGPQTVYVNDRNVKSIDSQGRLDTLHALDGLIEDWKDDLADYVSVGFDSLSSCLFILNSNKKKAGLMWFGTSSVSELHDLPFSKVETGAWPSNLSDADSDLTEYAHFLQNHPNASSPSTGFSQCIWVADSKRSKTISGTRRSGFNGDERNTLLDGTGDTRFTVTSGGVGNLYLDCSVSGHQSLVDEFVSTSGNWIGAYVYIINSANESSIGEKAQITNVTLTANTAGKLEFTGSGVTTVGKTVTLISTDGTSKTYIADADSGSTGNLDGSGRVKFYNGGDKNDHAQILTNAINSSNGHNGKIVAAWSAGTGITTLTQATAGSAGNTTITSDLNECTVTQFSGATTKLTLQNPSLNWSNITAGDRVGISPMFVRWSGSLLGYNDSVDQTSPTPGGLHKVRLVDSMSTFFSTVSGASFTDTVNTAECAYKGLVFEGDSDTVKASGLPKNLSGTITKSIVEGESINWAAPEKHSVRGMALSPGIEVFCPDLDFRLLSVIIEGKVMSTLRTERAT